MKLPKSGKLYFGLAGGALLLTAGFLYLQKGALDDLTAQADQLQVTADKEKGANEKLVQAQKDLTALQTQLSHLEQGIPDAAYVPTMLKELEDLGKSDNVEVTGLRPAMKRPDLTNNPDKKNIDTKPYEPLDLELKGKANYTDFIKYVTALNKFPKILEVRTVTITPPAGAGVNGGDARLELTMGIRAFLFKAPADAAPKVGESA